MEFTLKIEELYQIYLKHPKISTDSRKIESGIFYFALKGERFDGNTFALQALQNGASFAVIDNPQFYIDNRTILVKNVLTVLQDLARYHRRKLNIPVLAITGTNGKTTTKELVNSVLSQKFFVHATAGNLNNHIGVPLTLLSISSEHNFAVIEMGANHPLEIDQLCKIAEPDFGIITNIGKAHLEGFGGFGGVVKTKNELYDFLIQKQGIIFFNSDNRILFNLLDEKEVSKISYGVNTGNICKGTVVSADPFVIIEGLLNKDDNWNPFSIKTNLVGSYNLENVLAAVTIGKYFNVSVINIIKAIEEYYPSNNRSQLVKTKINTVLLDCYNANPSSSEAALLNLQQMPGENKIVILGDMLELGIEAEKEHRNILEIIENHCLTAILVGPVFQRMATEFGFMAFSDVDALYEWLLINPISDHIVLLKGSRGIKLEKVIGLL